MNLSEYLKEVGFWAHPFVMKAAEDEIHLPKYFVQGPYFSSVLGDPTNSTNTVYFAARGNGKSAMARMVKYLLTETTQYGPILVVDFSRDALDEVLDEVGRNVTRLNGKIYREKFLAYTRQALAEQRERLERFKGVLNLSFKVSNLKELAIKLNKAGVPSIYFLVDGVDELPETTADPSKGALLIQPALTDLSLLETPYSAFKFFLPLEIEKQLHDNNLARFDRLQALNDNWQWQHLELQELLTKRLSYFSNGKIESLGQLSDTPDIDERMCQAVRGSPRNLLRLGNFLLDEHLRFNLPPKINEEALKNALKRLNNTLSKEIGYRTSSFINPHPHPGEEQASENVAPAITDTSRYVWLKGNDVFIGQERVNPSPSGLELKLLKLLYEKRGETCSKDELLAGMYINEIPGVSSDEQLTATIKRLRKKLKDPSAQYFIETVWGVGYRLLHFIEPIQNLE